MWFLNYIEAKENKQNAFSQFGNHIHTCLEKYFKGELEIWDLVKYYQDHYNENVTALFPPYPAGMAENYYNEGLSFLEEFDFDKSLYEIINIEGYIDDEFEGIKIVVKPDLVLKSKETGKYILLDYKTKKLKGNKNDDKTIEEYKRQFVLYASILWSKLSIEISEIQIWFIRNKQVVIVPFTPEEAFDNLQWFKGVVDKIKQEEKWEPNLSKESKYFCDQICSMHEACKYRNGS